MPLLSHETDQRAAGLLDADPGQAQVLHSQQKQARWEGCTSTHMHRA
jgi:hypothetical protein